MYPTWTWYYIAPIFIVVHFVVIGIVVAWKTKSGTFKSEDQDD